jgi:hypothetical protein
MKGYNYLACYLAGIFLIRLLPQLWNGFNPPTSSEHWSASSAGVSCYGLASSHSVTCGQ